MLVKAPDGRRWRVRRVWMSWRKVEDPLDHLPREPIRMTTVHLAAGLSALIQLAAFPFVVAWKLALQRPVRVEAVPIDDPADARSWQIAGFRPGRRAVHTLRDRIRAGAEPALPE